MAHIIIEAERVWISVPGSKETVGLPYDGFDLHRDLTITTTSN